MRLPLLLFCVSAPLLTSGWTGHEARGDSPSPTSMPAARTEADPADARFALETSPHFRAVHNADRQWVRTQLELMERAYARFFEAFGNPTFGATPSDQPLACTIFGSQGEFIRDARTTEGLDMSWSGGYYSGRTNRVALFMDAADALRAARRSKLAAADAPRSEPLPGAGAAPLAAGPAPGLRAHPELSPSGGGGAISPAKITHEATHQLAFNSGLQKRHVMYPLWASEGLATNFEAASAADPFGPTQDNAVRHRHLRQAVADELLLPLREFVVLTRVPVDAPRRIDAVYAQAWAFFHFLYQTQPENLARYFHALTELEPGPRDPATLGREFDAAFGPVERLDAAWQRFVRGLR